MFNPVESRVDFQALEKRILEWWDTNDIPRKYRGKNEGADKRYSFIDGPITANNPMGVHHAWGRTYKDLFLRYKAMQGYDQRFQNGFDGQGLWIEVEVEKDLGFKSKRDIESFGIGKFVELCKERVDRFADIISDQSKRLGYWMDWDNSYHTKSDQNNYTIWHFLKTCFEKGWMYEGRDVMPWCPRCGTGLSEHEIVTEGYKEIVHPGLFVKFPLLNNGPENTSLLIWTTTPWTLTSNIAAAVNPEKTYVKVTQGTDTLYLVKERIEVLNKDYEIVEEISGSDLIGLRYKSPFEELTAQKGIEHRVVAWDEVSDTEGTGIVHTAPGAGREDFALGKVENLPAIAPLDEYGDFIEGFDWLTGKNVYEVNEAIYSSLKEKGIFYRLDKYSHRYPVCWRCDSELVFRLVDEWFISMSELRHMISDVTKKIRWVPSFGLERELDWLRNMDDWMISKKRYYGLALPIYKCDCGRVHVLGSKQELKEQAIEGWSEFEEHSPHRPWIDAVKIKCEDCGESVSRISDVGNAWLDAGIVPFSTLGYGEDKDNWSKWFPADWISESFPGQFRNWFYSLLTMSTALENTEPFKNVFSYALMRDENGDDMHKSKGNAIWFEDAADQMGVDSMRWAFVRQNPAANINFGFKTADEVRRRFIIPLWNVYSFFVTYSNIDRFNPNSSAPAVSNRSELDRWIISELNQLISEVTTALDNFEPDKAARAIEGYVEYLSNWYVRRSRRRFWKSGTLEEQSGDEDKLSAYSTLYECLLTVSKLLAPFMPFVTEDMYGNLVSTSNRGAESVHLDDYPLSDENLIDIELSQSTRLAMKLSSLGRASRQNSGLKVRQPLAVAVVSIPVDSERKFLTTIENQLKDELNVAEIKDATEVEGVIRFEVKPNFQKLGPKHGKEMNTVRKLIEAADPAVLAGNVSSNKPILLEEFTILPEELLVEQYPLEGYSAASEGGYVVAVSVELTEDLIMEGQAREIVHRIQNMRRSAKFEISDYIEVNYQTDEILNAVMAKHQEYICQETLALSVSAENSADSDYSEEHDIDGSICRIDLTKSSSDGRV